MKYTVKSLVLGLFLSLLGLASASAQSSLYSPRGVDRVINRINDARRVTLTGNVHPLAQSRYDIGAVSDREPMSGMVLVLRPSDAQQKSLDALVAAQHDPNSPYYHQWLTPEQFGNLYGPSVADVASVQNWLLSQGFVIDEITPSRRYIIFSGDAGRVASAFATEIHRYRINGQTHVANVGNPTIPAALSSVVAGVLSLHDFRSAGQSLTRTLGSTSSPQFTSGGSHYMAPDDFAAIYNLKGLYSAGYDGSGQSIAVIARSNILLSDVRSFRAAHGLGANDPTVILNGSNDPGVSNISELTEAALDVEWAGAVARKASIKVVVSASTSSSDGAFLSAIYAVNNNVAPIITMSFGLCEKSMGSSGNAFINSLWQQAAAQGISVFVSSGDSGAAGCDSASLTKAVNGQGVNGICSTPYSTCVGGSQFNDSANPSTYWSPSNTGSRQSALGYIPEIAWNESSLGGLLASGGGPSSIYSKPSWQSSPGVLADGKRDTPDVSLSASIHDGYLIYFNGVLGAAGGTSAAAPAFAGLMALVNQKAGAAQGLANPYLYRMASNQYSNAAYNVFHDVTSGSNSVSGQSGYNATTGYDMATGLGSVDAYQLLQNWGTGSVAPSASGFSLSLNASTTSLPASGAALLTISAKSSGGFSSAVGLTVSGLPSGVTAVLSPTSIAGGSGSSILTLRASGAVATGSSTITVAAAGGSVTRTASFILNTVAAGSFTLAAASPSMQIANDSASDVLTIASVNGFSSNVSLAVTGAPIGVSLSLTPATISGGAGNSTLKAVAASFTTPGSYLLTVTAIGGSIKRTLNVTLNVPGILLSTGSRRGAYSLQSGGSISVSLLMLGGFSSTCKLTLSGLPSTVTATIANPTITTPGGSTSIKFVVAGARSPNFNLVVTATGGGRSTSLIIPISMLKTVNRYF